MATEQCVYRPDETILWESPNGNWIIGKFFDEHIDRDEFFVTDGWRVYFVSVYDNDELFIRGGHYVPKYVMEKVKQFMKRGDSK